MWLYTAGSLTALLYKQSLVMGNWVDKRQAGLPFNVIPCVNTSVGISFEVFQGLPKVAKHGQMWSNVHKVGQWLGPLIPTLPNVAKSVQTLTLNGCIWKHLADLFQGLPNSAKLSQNLHISDIGILIVLESRSRWANFELIWDFHEITKYIKYEQDSVKNAASRVFTRFSYNQLCDLEK